MRFFMPHLLACTGCSCDDRLGFFLSAFGLALNLRNRGDVISRTTDGIRAAHALFCHNNHLWVSIPRRGEVIPMG